MFKAYDSDISNYCCEPLETNKYDATPPSCSRKGQNGETANVAERDVNS